MHLQLLSAGWLHFFYLEARLFFLSPSYNFKCLFNIKRLVTTKANVYKNTKNISSIQALYIYIYIIN